MKNYMLWILLILMAVICACGEGLVRVENESYEPKIVIDGFLIANQKVEKIHVSRNFRLDDNLRQDGIIPDVQQTEVKIYDIEQGKYYNLTFHVAQDDKFENYYWEYNGNDLQIQSGKTYRIEISAIIEGRKLLANATTTVPEYGFNIISLNHNQLKYRQRDGNDNVMNFQILIERSPNITFYLTTLIARRYNVTNFIYNNPYEQIDPQEALDDGYYFEYGWIQNTAPTPGQSTILIEWSDLWFYSDYEIIVYACDENYENFLQTFNDTQEQDGNFHEPLFNIQGDGIGVFGSMIADTVSLSVMRD